MKGGRKRGRKAAPPSKFHARVGVVPRPRVLDEVADWDPLVVAAEFSGEKLARQCGVSLRHLQRHIKQTRGITLSAMVEVVRLEKARALLLTGSPVKVAALNLGYKQVSHFSRNFRNHFGLSPSKFVIQVWLGASPKKDKGISPAHDADDA